MVEKDFWDLTAVHKSLLCRTGLQRKGDWEEHTAALQTPGTPGSSNSKPDSNDGRGLPTTWSQLNLWLLSECESLSDSNGSRQRKRDCGALSYFLTSTSGILECHQEKPSGNRLLPTSMSLPLGRAAHLSPACSVGVEVGFCFLFPFLFSLTCAKISLGSVPIRP